MYLYDTLTAQKSALDIPQDRPLTLYVCGVTPYDTTHVGHARTFLIFDVLLRRLRAKGAEVYYCQNVTDVDDPLFERAARDGVAWESLAQRELQRFVDDCAALNLTPPNFFPKASEEMATIIPIIERLIELNHAYVNDGNVYFRVKSDPNYGAMARMSYDELLATANQRGNNPNDPLKEDPLDFVLWQRGKPGDPAWPSPWGPGRPGWHIECTAMSTKYLGSQIDIHGGGRDLIFPHHPSEIAQTEPVTGEHPFVRFWMHAGLVWLDGEKMSKSLGNMVFVRDVVAEHGADPLRWYLLTQPYREDFYYERGGIVEAKDCIERLERALTARSGSDAPLNATSVREAFLAALDDDLQLPQALQRLDNLASNILVASETGRDVRSAQTALREMAGVVGFWAAQILNIPDP
jgi:L-cysteine:1D-myo-inositol 2-amino-2-deoxy-alpha-D-glucopyranoside ligase